MVSNPDTAADLTQDAMVKIIQGLPTWDARAALTTWMIRVAMNVTLSHLRAQKLRRHASIEGLSEAGGRASRHAGPRSRVGPTGSGRPASLEQHREPDGPSSVQKEELRERVAGALAALEPDHRAILILRDMQDLDYEQIAAVLDVAVGTVKSRLFRARAALRQALEAGTNPPSDNPGADLRRNPDETA
jgi:RNA polymerase sigma-70 factor (ECF subfamily)